jgi:hypothetical protein
LYSKSTLIGYLWNSKTFHHKLIELLAVGVPVFSYPGESEESINLAKSYKGSLSVCQNENDIFQTLDQYVIHSDLKPYSLNVDIINKFSWGSSSGELEAFFNEYIEDK